MTNKPLTIDKILNRHIEQIVEITRSVVQNPQSPKAWLDAKDYGNNNSFVKDVSQLIAEIIGEDEPYKATFNHDTPTPETAAGIAKQKLRAEQRQRAKERGIDL